MNKTQIRPPGWRGNTKEGALRRLGLDHAAAIPAAYNLASITRHVRGGKTAFMELAESAAASYPCLGRLVELWNLLSRDDRRRVSLEEVCRAADIAPDELLGAVLRWCFKQNLDISKLLREIIHPRMLEGLAGYEIWLYPPGAGVEGYQLPSGEVGLIARPSGSHYPSG